jgi:sialate O-acetylesterase
MAMANVYGRKLEYSGPVYESMKISGNAVRLKFSHVGGGLVAKDGPLKWFVVAGADGKFVPAEARIEGDTVVVTSAEVSAPAAVRYAWDNYPEGCNLYNAAGLPAAPFRTDRWPYEY